MKLPHWAQLALGLAVVVVAWLMHQQAKGTLVLPAAVVAVLTVANTVLGLLSDAVGSQSSDKGQGQAGFARVRLMLAIAVVPAVMGCAWFASHPAVAPDAAQSAACVGEHALQGESVVQIAVACSMTVEKVLFDILDSQDAKVQACPAHAEAVHLQMAMSTAEGARLEQLQRDLDQLLHESGLGDAGAH